jgi:hypothetical protein
MSILEEASKPTRGAFFGTIAGDPGLGKSTLAATFPDAICLSVEDGMHRVREDLRPVCVVTKTYDRIKEALGAINKGDHGYKTLIIDSVTELDTVFCEYTVANDPKSPKSILQAAGGYGNGPKAVARMHENLRQACYNIHKNQGIHVVFIAHADTERMDLPDKDPYMRYSFRMMKESVKPYINNVDFVGFVRQEIFLHGEEGQRVKKARGSGDRVLDCVSRPSTVAKNMYGINDDLPLVEGVNPLLEYLHNA